MARPTRFVLVFVLALSLAPGLAGAQSLGLFSWQLAPFCNVVTVDVTQTDGIYRLTGADDQCGNGTLATAVGLGYPNRDGTIGLGLLIVTSPGGVPVHLSASLRRSDLSGGWRDSAGNSGEMLPPHARRTGGRARPEPVFGAVLVQPDGGPDRGFNVRREPRHGRRRRRRRGAVRAVRRRQRLRAAGQCGHPRRQRCGHRRDGHVAFRRRRARPGRQRRGRRGSRGRGRRCSCLARAWRHGAGDCRTARCACRESLRPAFVHVSDGGNTRGDSTCIDHALTNGQSEAIVLVTHRWGGSGVNVPHGRCVLRGRIAPLVRVHGEWRGDAAGSAVQRAGDHAVEHGSRRPLAWLAAFPSGFRLSL